MPSPTPDGGWVRGPVVPLPGQDTAPQAAPAVPWYDAAWAKVEQDAHAVGQDISAGAHDIAALNANVAPGIVKAPTSPTQVLQQMPAVHGIATRLLGPQSNLGLDLFIPGVGNTGIPTRIVRAAIQTGEGLSKPSNIALAAATEGLGELAGPAAEGVEQVGPAVEDEAEDEAASHAAGEAEPQPEAEPNPAEQGNKSVAHAARWAKRGVEGAFAYTNLRGAKQAGSTAIRQFQEAHDEVQSNPEQASRDAAKGYAAATQAVLNGLFGGGLALHTLADFLPDGSKNPLGDVIRKHTGQAQIDAYRDEAFALGLGKDTTPEAQEAIKHYINAGGDPAKLDQYADLIRKAKINPAVKERALGDIERAKNLTPAEKAVADRIVTRLTEQLHRGQAVGLYGDQDKATPDEAARAGYYPRQGAWEKTEDDRAKPGTGSGRGLRTTAQSALHRVFDSYAEGIAAGQTPTFEPLQKGVGDYLRESSKAIRDREFVRDLSAMQFKGAPAVIKSGSATISPDGATLVDAGGKQFVPVPGTEDNEEPQGMDTSDYRGISDGKVSRSTARALQAWRWLAKDAAGNPVLYRGDLLVHPELMEHLEKYLGDHSWLQEKMPWLLSANSAVKRSLLSFSPFHYVQEGVRGVLSGVHPFNLPEVDVDDPRTQNALRNGLVLRDSAYGSEGRVGLLDHYKTAVSKIFPGLVKDSPAIAQDVERGLFGPQGFVPRLKAAAFLKLEEEHPELSPQQIANHVNNLFGLLNHKALGWSAAAENRARLATLAPDFLEGEMRLYKGMGNDPLAQRFMAGNILKQYAASRIVSWLGSAAHNLQGAINNPILASHPESPFSATINGKTYASRSPMTDLDDFAKEPWRFFSYRVGPLVRMAWQTFDDKNYEGRPLTGRQHAAQVIGDGFPISAQGPVKSLIGGGSPFDSASGEEAFFRALGIEQFRDRTPAMHQALHSYISHYMARVPESDAAKQRFAQTFQLARELRPKALGGDGSLTMTQLRAKLAAKQITVQEFQDIAKMARQNPLVPLIEKFQPADVFKVWDRASLAERKAIYPELRKKYLGSAKYHPGQYRELAPQYAAASKWWAQHTQ